VLKVPERRAYAIAPQRMNIIELREVSLENLDEVIDLEVAADQKDLVADNLYSIAQAELEPNGWCWAAYLDDEPVGFTFVKQEDQGRQIYICRFMVDQRWQRRGLGRRIMMQLLDLLFSSPLVRLVDLAVSREPGGAEDFYKKCGFIATGEDFRGGSRMVLSRSRYHELYLPS
jgi:diamine N-acetyltransferase